MGNPMLVIQYILYVYVSNQNFKWILSHNLMIVIHDML